MRNDFESALERQGLASVETMVHRDFLAEEPRLREALGGGDLAPWAASAAASLLRRIPVLPCVSMPGADSPFVRPPRHARCFYYSPDGAQAGQPVFAFKGTEPLAPDFPMMLQVLESLLTPENAASHQRHLAEHFALVEQKVPGALLLREAEAEAETAARVQVRHLEAYGTPAHLPFPLMVARLPESTAQALLTALRQRLSSRAFSKVEGLVEGGLGVYVYYYPALPIRVSHLTGTLPQGTFSKRFEALSRKLSPEQVIDGWARQFIRLLYLGYLPVALGSVGTGTCCDSNNSVIDGGFVDLDSLIPFPELEHPGKARLVEDTLHLSTRLLCRTVRAFLAPPRTTIEERAVSDLPTHLVTQYVHSRLRHFLRTEARPQLKLDPRVTAYFEPELSFGSLKERLTAYYPALNLEDVLSSSK